MAALSHSLYTRAATDTALCGIEIGWESCAWLWNALWHLECSGSIYSAHGACANGTKHRHPESSADSAPVEPAAFSYRAALIHRVWTVWGKGCKVAQKAENKNLWRSGSLLWELGSRELKIADVLLFYPGGRVACVLWSVNNYSSWHDFSSICFLLITDEWLENSAQGCERAVQRLTKTGGYLEFSQKKKKTVSEAVQMLMPSYDLLYWATVQTLLGQEFFNFNLPIDILYIYLLLFKCFK